MTQREYILQVQEESRELIEAGHAIANAGYFMKRVLRENALAKKLIDKHNESLFKRQTEVKSIEVMENELERLQALLKQVRGE